MSTESLFTEDYYVWFPSPSGLQKFRGTPVDATGRVTLDRGFVSPGSEWSGNVVLAAFLSATPEQARERYRQDLDATIRRLERALAKTVVEKAEFLKSP